MNKTIFLDIDGVLNIYSESYKTNSVSFDTHFQETITRMEFHLVKRLEYIVENTDADIVLISGWDLESVKRVLKQNDFRYLDKIKSKLMLSDRVEGILEYIADNAIEDFIVLDDEIDIGKASRLDSNRLKIWVGTYISPHEGLTDRIARFAVKILNRKMY